MARRGAGSRVQGCAVTVRAAAGEASRPCRNAGGGWRADPCRRLASSVLGAVTVTAATGSFIYGMLNAGDAGWADLGTLLPIAAAIVLYGVFVIVERTVPTPLVRLSLLARRPIATGAFL